MAERFFGNCLRDLLDHAIVRNQHDFERLMTDYVRYPHDDRTYLGLNKQTPIRSKAPIQRPANANFSSMPGLGGVHHRSNFTSSARPIFWVEAAQHGTEAECAWLAAPRADFDLFAKSGHALSSFTAPQLRAVSVKSRAILQPEFILARHALSKFHLCSVAVIRHKENHFLLALAPPRGNFLSVH